MPKTPANILIIDDDKDVLTTARMFLKQLFAHVQVENDPEQISIHLSEIDFDIILLDMNFKKGKSDGQEGMYWLNQILEINPGIVVIFITAYQEFALKAIKFSALDYILKPVDPEELINAVNDAGKLISADQQSQIQHLKDSLSNTDQSEKRILLKTSENIHLLRVSDIRYCEADGGYTRFFTNQDQEILVSRPLAEYEDLFAEYGFYRVHKSFLANLHKVERFEKEDGGYLVIDGEVKVPVASRKKDQLIQLLEKITE